jgi:hypothetical protein
VCVQAVHNGLVTESRSQSHPQWIMGCHTYVSVFIVTGSLHAEYEDDEPDYEVTCSLRTEYKDKHEDDDPLPGEKCRTCNMPPM